MVYRPESRRGAFTLIELLVVLAVIGTLSALILGAVQAARESARRTRCFNNLKQVGIALNSYHTSHNSYPPGYISWKSPEVKKTAPGWGWASMILPQLEDRPKFDAINFSLPIEHQSNATVCTSGVGILLCPSDTHAGRFTVRGNDGVPIVDAQTTSYAANYGSGGMLVESPGRGDGLFLRNRAIRLDDIRDGAGNTIAVGERGSSLVQYAWTGPIDGGVGVVTPGAPVAGGNRGLGAAQALAYPPSGTLNGPESTPENFFGTHSSIVPFVMADGSVRGLARSLDPKVLRALASRNLGEVIDSSSY